MEGNTSKTLTFKIPIKWLPDELINVATLSFYLIKGDFTWRLEQLEGVNDATNQLKWLKSYLKDKMKDLLNVEKIWIKTYSNSNYISIEINR